MLTTTFNYFSDTLTATWTLSQLEVTEAVHRLEQETESNVSINNNQTHTPASCFFLSSEIFSVPVSSSSCPSSSHFNQSWRMEFARSTCKNGRRGVKCPVNDALFGIYLRKMSPKGCSTRVSLKVNFYNFFNQKVLSIKTNSWIVFDDPCVRLGWGSLLSQRDFLNFISSSTPASRSSSSKTRTSSFTSCTLRNDVKNTLTGLSSCFRDISMSPYPVSLSSTEGLSIRCQITFHESSFDPPDKGLKILQFLSHDLSHVFMDRTFLNFNLLTTYKFPDDGRRGYNWNSLGSRGEEEGYNKKKTKKNLSQEDRRTRDEGEEEKEKDDMNMLNCKKSLHRKTVKLRMLFHNKMMEYYGEQDKDPEAVVAKNGKEIHLFPSVICFDSSSTLPSSTGVKLSDPRKSCKNRVIDENYTWPKRTFKQTPMTVSLKSTQKEDCKLFIFECILDFCTTGSLKCFINNRLLLNLFIHAVYYRIHPLKHHVESLLCNDINDDIVIQAVIQSNFYSSPKIFDSCITYICSRLKNYLGSILSLSCLNIFPNFDAAAHLHPDLMDKVLRRCNRKRSFHTFIQQEQQEEKMKSLQRQEEPLIPKTRCCCLHRETWV